MRGGVQVGRVKAGSTDDLSKDVEAKLVECRWLFKVGAGREIHVPHLSVGGCITEGAKTSHAYNQIALKRRDIR